MESEEATSSYDVCIIPLKNECIWLNIFVLSETFAVKVIDLGNFNILQ